MQLTSAQSRTASMWEMPTLERGFVPNIQTAVTDLPSTFKAWTSTHLYDPGRADETDLE